LSAPLFEQLCKQTRQLCASQVSGVYDHYTPAVVTDIVGRRSFLQVTTPYWPKCPQGSHYNFEYQSMMAELTGMDVANASMYDGTTATAEAVLMAAAVSKKQQRVLVSETVDPKTRAVVQAYTCHRDIDLVTVPQSGGVTTSSPLCSAGIWGRGRVVVQHPQLRRHRRQYRLCRCRQNKRPSL
jgi:glycine dehydrogenase subunit 1